MIKGFLSALQKIKVKEPNETDKIIDNIEEVIDEVLEKQHIGSSHNTIDKNIVDFNKYLSQNYLFTTSTKQTLKQIASRINWP